MRNAYSLMMLAVVAGLCGCTGPLSREGAGSSRLGHNVYFTLNDNAPAARAKLVADCYTYLSGEPGITYFAAGEIVESHAREVNVRDWDVSLHIEFKSKDCHDAYQKAPKHARFIEENKDNWKTVRVFDTFVK